MMRLGFHGGAGEIGGNKILLEGQNTKLWLDFGMSFKKHGRYFSDFLQPRTSNALGDFLSLGLIPDMPGLYRSDFLEHMGLEAETGPAYDGVLVSHAHLDHLGHVNLLHEAMPVFASDITRRIAGALDHLGSGSQSDFVKVTKSFGYYTNSRGGVSRLKSCRDPEQKYRPRIYPLDTDRGSFRAGGADIEIWPVDHSLPGASGYIIHLDGMTVGYTGDIRFHGQRPDLSRAFVDALASSRPDILLTEGTNITETGGLGEAEVEERISGMIADVGGSHVFASFPARDTYRLMSFYRAAKENGRKLAIGYKQAYLLDMLAGCGVLESGRDLVPSTDPHIAVYLKKHDYGLIGRDADPEEIARDYGKPEREYLGRDNQVCWKDLRDEPGDYVMFLDNYSVQEMVDIKPAAGSVYIKSQCEPFDPEMEMDWDRIKHWLDHFGLRVMRAHASGHMHRPEIAEMLEAVEPGVVIPVHTEHPEEFRAVTDADLRIPEPGGILKFPAR